MNSIRGDLLHMALSGQFDIIVQGCNCFNTMGSGIAAQIREVFPDAWEADQATLAGSYDKLGNYTWATHALSEHDQKLIVVNAYTQYRFNGSGQREDHFNYIAFRLILEKLAQRWPGRRWGFPAIGCGLAGGDRGIIMDMIQWFSETVEPASGTVTVVEYQPKENQ